MRLCIPCRLLISTVFLCSGQELCYGFTFGLSKARIGIHNKANTENEGKTSTRTTTNHGMVFDITDAEFPSTSYFKSSVDMNVYNLPLDQIAQEWKAVLVPESSLREEGIYLGAKSSKTIMVDSLRVEIPRKAGQGMGIELLEIAGGREDGYGITVVNGIVPGGCADDVADSIDLQLGDSIVKVAVVRKSTSSGSNGEIQTVEEIVSVDTECLGYDKTVEAIGSLPPAETNDEMIVLTLKRLRRKPKVTVKLQYPPSQKESDTTIELFAGENLRRAMLTRGVKLNDPLSRRFDSGGTGDCGAEGTCATCVVNIVRGKELLNPPGIQEEQMLIKNPRWRLACRAIVGHGMQEGEMMIRVNPRQWAD